MRYEVSLEVFEGPIDLLLHLITRRRVDIYEVSLATITEEYLRVVTAMDELDLDTATGFLVVAATLLELKSARLLPGRTGQDGRLLEERDLLLARLVECATFRDAGAWLGTELTAGGAFHGRTAALETPYARLAPDILGRTRAADLARAAAAVLTRARPEAEPLDTSHIAPITASVKDAIARLATRLATASELTFAELCPAGAPRIEVVVRFLALLELFKAGAVDLSQADRFSEIRAWWTGDARVEDVLLEADEYASQAPVR